MAPVAVAEFGYFVNVAEKVTTIGGFLKDKRSCGKKGLIHVATRCVHQSRRTLPCLKKMPSAQRGSQKLLVEEVDQVVLGIAIWVGWTRDAAQGNCSAKLEIQFGTIDEMAQGAWIVWAQGLGSGGSVEVLRGHRQWQGINSHVAVLVGVAGPDYLLTTDDSQVLEGIRCWQLASPDDGKRRVDSAWLTCASMLY